MNDDRGRRRYNRSRKLWLLRAGTAVLKLLIRQGAGKSRPSSVSRALRTSIFVMVGFFSPSDGLCG